MMLDIFFIYSFFFVFGPKYSLYPIYFLRFCILFSQKVKVPLKKELRQSFTHVYR